MWPKACIHAPEVTTLEELQVLIAKKMDEGLDLYGYNLPYMFYLCPNVDGKHGYVFFMSTHAFFDGISILSAFTAMTKDKDFSLMRQVPDPTFTQRVLGNLFAPIGMIRVALQLLMLPFERNVVK